MCYYFSKWKALTILPASKTVFKSADESPKLLMSREGSKSSFCPGFVL
jgi:hypothetical protein